MVMTQETETRDMFGNELNVHMTRDSVKYLQETMNGKGLRAK